MYVFPNPWKPLKPPYKCYEEPEEYKGFRIFKNTEDPHGDQWLVVQADDTVLSCLAGPNGAKRYIDKLISPGE